MALTVCNEPRCPTLTDNAYCDKHTRARRQATDSERPSAHRRGYDRKWARTRGAYLYRHPTCEDESGCSEPAVDVHHRDGKGPNGPLGHTWSNLQALCKSHHSAKTARQTGGWAT